MSDSIKVAIKVRPLIKRETEENLPIQWTVQGNSIAPLDPELKKRGEGGFYFDHIFDMSASNSNLFDIVAKPIVDAALSGVNGTIFAYGQTSSGKTYTMMGSDSNPGVIPLAVDYVFDAIANTYGREFLLRVSYIEIYNERVNDLLDKNRIDLKVKEDNKGQVVVPCKEEVINSAAKVLAMMRKGDGNRRTGETNMNERSSRSHTIFRITIESRESNGGSEGAVNVSQLNLVDLAGSERARQTGATGERFNEGRHINMSLSALGLVIMQLSECQDTQKYVNFRDSKLTRILQASLGGNAMTTIICAITPAALEETQCTLAFASRAKRVKNKPQVNEVVSDAALLKRYAKQMEKLRAELEKAKSADVVEMESKLLEKERANQILEERIELLKKSIVCGSNTPDGDGSSRKARRRRTWAGSGTLPSKIPPFQRNMGLPTIVELDKTPEKTKKSDVKKRRQTIIQDLDIVNQTFQTEWTDFELELIESERARCDRSSTGSSVCDDEYFVTKRPSRNVQFEDDVAVIGAYSRSAETTPERKPRASSGGEPESPTTPKALLRSRIIFLMEEYNALSKDHRNLEEFTKLERQMYVDDAVEEAMAEHNRIVTDLEEKLAQSATSNEALKRENEALKEDLNKSKTAKTRDESRTTNGLKETSSIFANDTYFDELETSDAPSESTSINETQSLGDLTAHRLDESKKSKELTNAAYSEFIKQIGDKTSDELVTAMRELVNARFSLEEENSKLQTMLRRKIREADDVKNDIRELKSGIEKLQDTINALTNENTDLTSKLLAEKEHAKETEKSLQTTIEELNSSINAMTDEKTLLENSSKEFDVDFQTRPKTASPIDEELRESIEKYKQTIASLTAENEELSSSLMNKIEELDRLKDENSPPFDHKCAYRELTINLSDRNKLLESENIELSNNLMEKIEEHDRVKNELASLKLKISPSNFDEESTKIVEITTYRTNLMDDEKSSVDAGETSKNTKETDDCKSSNLFVDDLVRLSIGGEISNPRNPEKSSKNDVDLLRLSTFETEKSPRGSTIDEITEITKESNESSVISSPTIDELLKISFVVDETNRENHEKIRSRDHDVETWKKKALMLQERVDNLTLLNDKLNQLKITTCEQCSHLAELNENKKSLKIEAKILNRKLQELQEKFDRECADSELLRTKANEDLNLSVCDSTINSSVIFDENNLNVSYVEKKVQSLNRELDELRDKHDRLADLYKDKCDEIDKLHDVCSRETTPTPTSNDSPRIKRTDVKLERIQTDMEKLRTDFRVFKKNIASIGNALQKFVTEKLSMQMEIDSLRAEKVANVSKISDVSRENDEIVALKSELSRLESDICASNVAVEELKSAKRSLEAEVESLRAEKLIFERNMEFKDTSKDRETIKILENAIKRLSEEIRISNVAGQTLEDAKISLEAEVRSLKTEKTKFNDDNSEIDDATLERIKSLESELNRLNEKISDSKTDDDALARAKSALEAEVEALSAEKIIFQEKITNIDDDSSTKEKMLFLENEVTRLNEEIKIANAIKDDLSAAKSSLESQIESLKAEKICDVKFDDVSPMEEKIRFLENELARLKTHSTNLIKREQELNDLSSMENDEDRSESVKSVDEENSNVENVSMTQETMKYLENEVSRLSEEINHSNEVKEGLESTKISLEAEVEFLKAEKIAFDEKITQTEDTSSQERIFVLETEVERLNNEIMRSNVVKEELEIAKSSLEAEVEYLKAEKAETATENASTARERISLLETELNRLSNEIDGSNSLHEQSKTVKTSLEQEIESLKGEKKIREDYIKDLLVTLQNQSTNPKNNEIIDKIVETYENKNSPNNNDEDLSKVIESLQLKFNETDQRLQKFMKINEELTNRLTIIEISESDLKSVKSRLENEVSALEIEKTDYETTISTLQDTIEQLRTTEATITRLQDIENTLKQREIENTELKEKLNISERYEKELNDAKIEITNLQTKINSLQNNLENANRDVADLRETNDSLTVELEKARMEESSKQFELEIENSSYETLREYEKMVEQLRAKVHDITNDLHANAEETASLNDQLTILNNAKDELNNARSALESQVTNLKTERDDLEANLIGLRLTLIDLETKNSSLDNELQLLKNEKLKITETLNENLQKSDIREYEEKIELMTAKIQELTAELRKYAEENQELSSKVAELEETVESLNLEAEKISHNEKSSESTEKIASKQFDELNFGRDCITKEIKSLKPTMDNREIDDKSVSELFGIFVHAIMSKEQEIIKALSDRFDREKCKLEEQIRQSCDAEKRSTIWAKELEAEIERTQQDLTTREKKCFELNNEIAKLQNLLKESAHENQSLNEKMNLLEQDFNALQSELEKNPEVRQNVILNTTQERERLIQDAVDSREMELSAKLRLIEKQSREKFEELTKIAENLRTKNLELTNNIEGLEANEKQLKTIADMKTNELIKSNATVEKLQRRLETMTIDHKKLNENHEKTIRQIDEITTVMKTKCDKLSEYKTKLETITPEYEHLKDQSAERQIRLEKYKSEIECLKTDNEKEISTLKDRLITEEIESSGLRKQLTDLTNRNIILQTEITELRSKCDELERANGKLTKSMRNSTSKIRAEEEMEDLRDENRTLQRNLEGASNRITDLQETKTQMLKEIVDLRGKYEALSNENSQMIKALSSHRENVSASLELRAKHEALLCDNNRLALELEGNKSFVSQMTKKLNDCETEIERLKLTNKELDEEMEDMVSHIDELKKENAELDDKLYALTTTSTETSSNVVELRRSKTEINEETSRLKLQIENLQSSVETLKNQRDSLRDELANVSKSLEIFKNENSELRVKLGNFDRGDSTSCDSSRSESPAFEKSGRADNRRRRSRTELFNQKRNLEIFEPDRPNCCGECRCAVLQEEVCKLERDLVTKNGEIAAMEIRIQSENFPHMKRCKDLDELLASSRRKCKGLEIELQKLRELKVTELSSECDKCRHWRTNKCDQSTQCLPKSAPIYLSGMSSGIVEDHIKMAKLVKDKETLKTLCRNRQKRIFELEATIKELLEKDSNVKSSTFDLEMDATGISSVSTSSKSDFPVNSRQAMKENVPTIWDYQRPANHSRRDWFN